MLYYTIFFLLRFWLIQFPSVTMLDKKQEKWRGMEEERKNREKQLCIRLFSYLFCWFWVFSCLFTAVKEIKRININGCDIAIEWLKIDRILMCYFLFLFSFYFFSLFFCALFFSVRALFSFYNLVEIDCGFSRRVASVSTIFFFILFGIHFLFYFNNRLPFFCALVSWIQDLLCLY